MENKWRSSLGSWFHSQSMAPSDAQDKGECHAQGAGAVTATSQVHLQERDVRNHEAVAGTSPAPRAWLVPER